MGGWRRAYKVLHDGLVREQVARALHELDHRWRDDGAPLWLGHHAATLPDRDAAAGLIELKRLTLIFEVRDELLRKGHCLLGVTRFTLLLRRWFTLQKRRLER